MIGAEENIAYLNFNNNQYFTSLKMDSAAPEVFMETEITCHCCSLEMFQT